jgi:hypothetical protein
MNANNDRSRLPRHQRVPEADRPPMALTERDCELIRMVNDCRLLRTDQIAALFFGSRSTAQYRLARLFQHEFLERHFLSVVSGAPGKSPALYTIGKRGAQTLVERYGYERGDLRLPKRGTLGWHLVEHLLAVNDVRVAITCAARQDGLTLETWLDETTFRAQPEYVTVTDQRGKTHQKPVFPDGYCCLQTPHGTARFFLEVDRGTEPLAKFSPQIAIYEAYVASGQYHARFQAKSLRILVVTTTARRLHNLLRVTQQVGGKRKYWFTTFDRITAQSVLTAPIWQHLGQEGLFALVDGGE